MTIKKKNLAFVKKKFWLQMACEKKSSFNINWKQKSAENKSSSPPRNEMVAPLCDT